MSIVKNTLSNYIGKLYTTIVGIIAMPLYLEHLGPESFGLVAFGILLQSWLNILDIGISPTLARQVSCERGLNEKNDNLVKLLRSFEIIFFILSAVTIVTIYLGSNWIANEWINIQDLDRDLVSYCVAIMGLMIGFNFFSSLYKSGVVGLERQVWLNKINILFSTLRVVIAVILFKYFSTNVLYFFVLQATVSLIALITVGFYFYAKTPNNSKIGIVFSFDSIRKHGPYALSLAYSAVLWIIVSQTDKLILSSNLSLGEYGYFTMVVLVGSSIATMTSPISIALLPRMVFFLSQNKEKEMISIYRKASQLALVVSITITIVIALYSQQILFLWTGDKEFSEWGKDILFWYALGNGVACLNAFQSYLQKAIGVLKWHVIGLTISGIIQAPILYYIATSYGVYEISIAWFVIRIMWFFLWVPFIHNTYLPGFHIKWMVNDIFPIILSGAVLAILINSFVIFNSHSVFIELITIILTGSVVLICTGLSSKFIRMYLYNNYVKKYISNSHIS